MKRFLPATRVSLYPHVIAAIFLTCLTAPTNAEDHRPPRVNQYSAPVLDAAGQQIRYDRRSLEAMVGKNGDAKRRNLSVTAASKPGPRGFVPAGGSAQQPFWQYAIFGSGIGASNIVIGPRPVGGGAPEIIIGGNSTNNFGSDDFWQAIRYNSTTGNYDTVFVSPIYKPRDGDFFVGVQRIGLAHVTTPSDWQIVVMLEDGRIYLYDFASKAEVGHLETGTNDLQGLSLTDLDGDGLAEMIITSTNDLFVFKADGSQLWQVAGAGGYEVVAGQMDDDPAIEIATTSGNVVDATTHAVQWTRSGGFGYHLALAPLPGSSYKQLIAAQGWQYVYSYDVAQQLPRWSITTPQDIGAIYVADVDNDSVPEVIIGDNQWGGVHVHDLVTQALKWAANNPEHGVTNIAVGDVDGDGIVDLLWGAGWTSTGPDYLYVASTTGSHGIKWQSVDLGGPFLGPAIGDLDGDGNPELVICAPYSESGYDGGRILVFDLSTLNLRGISAPVGFFDGVRDFKLRDVDQDGQMRILISTDGYSAGLKIYRFDPNNTFTQTWPSGMLPNVSFDFVEAADLDGNGTRKIIAGSYDGYVYIFDYPSESNPWRSIQLGDEVVGLAVEDLDGNGSREIVALSSYDNGDLYTWDGPSRELRNLRQNTGATILSNRASSAGLVLGDNMGVGHFLQYASNHYTETFTRQLATDCEEYSYYPCIHGLNVTSEGALWTGSGSILERRLGPSYDTVVWQSPEIGNNFGGSVVTTSRDGQSCVFSSAKHAVVGLTYVGITAPTAGGPTDVSSSGFVANWGAITVATGYRLDLSTNSAFSSYVSGYQNRDVGNVTGRAISGLNSGTNYYYRVRAYSGEGSSGNSNVISVITIPAAPTPNTATDVTSRSFVANWGNSTGARGYRLDVSTHSSFADYVHGYQDRNVGGATSFGVKGLSANTTYYYRVRAHNGSGASGDSSVINVLTGVPGSPAPHPSATPKPSPTPGATPSPTSRPSATPK